MTSRLAVAVYAVIAYGAFVVSTLWAIGFLAGRGAPTSVDGSARFPALASIAIDAALLLAFAVQHTVMARAGFKRRLTRLIPESAERSTYVLAASLLLGATFGWFRPVPTVVWSFGGLWSAVVWVVYALGWVIAVSSTFMIDHADFLGLKQAYRYLRRLGSTSPEFTQRWLYAWCRHPLMLGLLIVFWAGFIATFAPAVIRWPILVQAPFYLIMGTAWIIPLKPLIRWSQSGQFKAPRE